VDGDDGPRPEIAGLIASFLDRLDQQGC